MEMISRLVLQSTSLCNCKTGGVDLKNRCKVKLLNRLWEGAGATAASNGTKKQGIAVEERFGVDGRVRSVSDLEVLAPGNAAIEFDVDAVNPDGKVGDGELPKVLG